jgi:hypothetical protein
MREWWENWRYEWRDWLESGMWRLSMAAMAGLALIFAGWNWAPHATFEIMRIGMGLGAIAFLAVMAWFFVTKVWTKVFRPVWLNWKAITAEARLNGEINRPILFRTFALSDPPGRRHFGHDFKSGQIL